MLRKTAPDPYSSYSCDWKSSIAVGWRLAAYSTVGIERRSCPANFSCPALGLQLDRRPLCG